MPKTCNVRKPGWENGPAVGRHRIPCIRREHHIGDHRDGLGQTWPQVEKPEPSEAAETKSAERLAFEAECEAFESLKLRKEEWRHIDEKLTALHRRRFEGDTSELTRQKISRLEALQACLCGDANALAQEPARRSYRA